MSPGDTSSSLVSSSPVAGSPAAGSAPALGALPRRSPVWRDAVAVLTRYAPADAEQRDWRAAYLEALADDLAVFKGGPPVHLTASCIVLDHTGEQVLLTLHRRARRWFQFGGHIESDDPTLHAAAEREVREESGIADIVVDADIVELHRHELGPQFGRCAEHLDVRFVGRAAPGAEPVCSAESLDVRWWPVTGLPEGTLGELRQLIERARARG